MNIKSLLTANTLASALLSMALFFSTSAWGCDAAGKSTHVGNLTSVNAQQKTFTIQDAQTNSTITFAANSEIIDGLKQANGAIMVNYQEDGDKLTAIGVTF